MSRSPVQEIWYSWARSRSNFSDDVNFNPGTVTNCDKVREIGQHLKWQKCSLGQKSFHAIWYDISWKVFASTEYYFQNLAGDKKCKWDQLSPPYVWRWQGCWLSFWYTQLLVHRTVVGTSHCLKTCCTYEKMFTTNNTCHKFGQPDSRNICVKKGNWILLCLSTC